MHPTRATVGSSIVVSGSNFDSIPSNNVVYLGGISATVVDAAQDSLTVLVPPGVTYAPVSVTVRGLTTFSRDQITILFESHSPMMLSSFSDSVHLSSGGFFPAGLALGDLDADGKLDLVAANGNSLSLSVFHNQSTPGNLSSSSFEGPQILSTNVEPYKVVTSDIDGDGKLDIVATNRGFSGGSTVSVMRNLSTSGTLSFEPQLEFGTAQNPSALIVADLDLDGRPDIVVTSYGVDSVSVLRNISVVDTIRFEPYITLRAGCGLTDVAGHDIDGDGKPEIITSNSCGNSFSVLHNESTPGSFSFDVPVYFFTSGNPFSITIADVDGDTSPDVITNAYSFFDVFLNTSTPGGITTSSFAAKESFPASPGLRQTTAMSDLDGDGVMDIVVASPDSNSISVSLGRSVIDTVRFAGRFEVPVGIAPLDVAVGDLDADGRPDLVSLNNMDASLTLYRNLLGDTYSIEAVSGENGTISPSGVVQVYHGANQEFTITPDAGYFISDVYVDTASVGAVSGYTFPYVAKSHIISASFAPDTFVITASAEPHGAISPAGTVRVPYGADMLFTMTPDPGFEIDSVIVDGVDVDSTSSYTFSFVASDHTIRVTFTGDVTEMLVDEGWNLVSVPRVVADRSLHSLWPNAISSAFAYQGRYVRADSLELGKGYWVKFQAAETLTVEGPRMSRDTIQLDEKWNVIGSISAPTLTTSIEQLPEGVIISPYYGYDLGYFVADTLQPGEAYWVKAAEHGGVILASDGLLAKPQFSGQTRISLAGFSRLAFTPGRKPVRPGVRSADLYFGVPQGQFIDERSWDLPPLPPAEAFDVRFASGRFVQSLSLSSSAQIEIPVSVQSPQPDLFVRWQIRHIDGKECYLQVRRGELVVRRIRLAGEGSDAVDLNDGERLFLVAESPPSRYELEQNYPNPFNPVTTIRFALPRESIVHITVYDVLGRVVAVLTDAALDQGQHAVDWDASAFGSGVYFCRLEATVARGTRESSVQMIRMVLMR